MAKPASKNAEKLAANQKLPVENLLEQFLREQFAPNPESSDNYYLGRVLEVYEQKDNPYGVYDIFNDSTSNLDRFFIGSKTSEVKVSKIIVHIPELFSTNSSNKDLYSHYTKFKINYYKDKDPIKKNDIVKILFKNKETFSDPEIVSKYRAASSDFDLKEEKKISESFEEYNNCRFLQLVGSQGSAADRNLSLSDLPIAGYKEAANTLNEIFNKEIGYINLSKELLENQVFLKKLEDNLKYKIYCDDKVKKYGFLNTQKDSDAAPEFEEERKEYDINLRIFYDNISDVGGPKILSEVSKYVDRKLSKFKFIIKINDIKPEKDFFYVDININVAAVPLEAVDQTRSLLDQFIEASDAGGFINLPAKNGAPQSATKIIIPNSTNQECDNIIPSVKNLYIPISSITRNRLLADGAFIDYFLKERTSTSKLPINYPVQPEKTEDILQKVNLYISGELMKKNKTEPFYSFEDLKKIDNDFYSIPQSVENFIEKNKKNNPKLEEIAINSSFKLQKGVKNFITETALDNRIYFLSNFLLSLKEFIQENEKRSSDNVLILPINVIRAHSKSEKKESRHFYGMAADITVYINFSDDPKKPDIYQIPPEIVYLYCKKLSNIKENIGKTNLGQGVFMNEEQYNHVEFLLPPPLILEEQNPNNVFAGLPKDVLRNGDLWIVGWAKNEKEKKKLNQPVDKVEKEFISFIANKYQNDVVGGTISKIMRLM